MVSNKKLPLHGIRIIEFSWIAAGPYVGRELAFFGAEVIRIESAARPDLSRNLPPFLKGKDGLTYGGLFINMNLNKLGITLNMSKPKARELARELIKTSDIVTDNFTPDVMKSWGLHYDELVKIKPDIITLSMPVMGSTGPRRDFGGYGTGIQAASGLNSFTGLPGRPPIGTGLAYPDYGPNPSHAAIALLAALHYRNKTGKGQRIEIAQYESTICYTDTMILDYTINNHQQIPMGNRLPYAAPHGAYRCKGDDRWCVIAVFTDEEWETFCNIIGNPPWAREERFATLIGRKVHEDELDRLVDEWTSSRTAEDVVSLMQHGGVAAGIIENGQDLLELDPQVREREYFVVLDHPQVGKLPWDGVTIKLSATPGEVRYPAPVLGEHNDYVFREIIGMTEEEIDQCIVDEVIY